MATNVTERHVVKDTPGTESSTSNDKATAPNSATQSTDVDEVPVREPATTNDKANALHSVTESTDVNEVPVTEPATTDDKTNTPHSVTESTDVDEVLVTEPATADGRTEASCSVTETNVVEDTIDTEPVTTNDITEASCSGTETGVVEDIPVTEPATTNDGIKASCSVLLTTLVLVAPTLIALAWIVYYNVLKSADIVILINIIETLMALSSIVFIGSTLVISVISVCTNGVYSSSQYNLLRHYSTEAADRKLTLLTVVLMTTLLLGYITFGVFQSINTASCRHEDISAVFKLIRDIAEIVFAVTQVLFLVVSMSKWSKYVGIKLDNLLAVILSTNLVFILRFCMQAYGDYQNHDLSQLPNLNLCTTSYNASICDAYTNNDTASMYINAYLYTFEVEYLLLCMVTISLFYGVDVGEDEERETPELILVVPPSDTTPRLISKLLISIRNWFMLTLKFVSHNAFHISTIVCILKFVSSAYMHAFNLNMNECNTTIGDYIIYENQSETSESSKIITGLGTAFSYMLSIVAFLAAVLTTETDTFKRIKLNPNDWMLLVVSLLHFLLTVLETVEIIAERVEGMPEDDYVTHTLEAFIAFHFLGVFCQPLFLLHYLKHQRSADTTFFRYIFARGCIVFLGVCNFEQWIEDILFAPEVMVFLTEAKWETYFELSQWWLIVKLLYPFVCFYRLLSSLMCCRGFIIRNNG